MQGLDLQVYQYCVTADPFISTVQKSSSISTLDPPSPIHASLYINMKNKVHIRLFSNSETGGTYVVCILLGISPASEV